MPTTVHARCIVVSVETKGESKVIGGKDGDKKIVIDRLTRGGTRLDRF